MPVRLLFLNTRDQCGADVAVHLMLMKNFSADEAEIFVVSNSEAVDAQEMRDRFAAMPHVTSKFLPLGKPSSALSGKAKLGKALAYGPSVASLLRTAAYIRRNRIQVIHATDRPRDASYASLLGRLTGTASVVHMHAPVSELTRPTLWGLRNSTAVFAVSDFTRSCLVDEGISAQKIYTIHNSVDATHFDPAIELGARGSIREQFGIPRDARIAGIAARMNPWKGQRELLGAVSMLKHTFPNLHVMILGANVPEIRAMFEQQAREGGIADRVHYGGYQTDVRPFLHEFDLFVHPSYGEPFGLSIAEAMAMRRPVIACGSGGVPEIITHGKDGWLVEERSTEAVATAMVKLLNDGDLCRQLGERARETIRDRFSPRRQCATVAERYTNLLAAA
ncbi:MAG TPA: glycosyltransferase family 4 protein [Steroidobacteraceae bacterium]